MEKKYLDVWKGKVCVVIESPLYGSPKLVSSYYPTGINKSEFEEAQKIYGEKLLGKSVKKYDRGTYQITGKKLIIYLTNGDNTKPIHTKVTPIPCPKVRKGTEVRYREGKWQKYLKTKGWVRA